MYKPDFEYYRRFDHLEKKERDAGYQRENTAPGYGKACMRCGRVGENGVHFAQNKNKYKVSFKKRCNECLKFMRRWERSS